MFTRKSPLNPKFLCICFLIHLAFHKNYLFFPGEEDLKWGVYKVEDIGNEGRFSGILLRMVDLNGDGIRFSGTNVKENEKLYNKLLRSKGLDIFYEVAWYPQCEFPALNLEYPCAMEVIINFQEIEILNYEDSFERFYFFLKQKGLFSLFIILLYFRLYGTFVFIGR